MLERDKERGGQEGLLDHLSPLGRWMTSQRHQHPPHVVHLAGRNGNACLATSMKSLGLKVCCFCRWSWSTLEPRRLSSALSANASLPPPRSPRPSPLSLSLIVCPSLAQRLNDEQLKLLETKPLLEFALAEHERVKAAIEAVAKELEREAAEQAKLAPPAPAAGLSITADSEPEQPATAAASLSIPAADPGQGNGQEQRDGGDTLTREEQQQQHASGKTAIEDEVSVETESIGVSTDPLATEESAVQTDVSGPPPPPGLDPRTVSEAVAMAATLALQEKDKAAQEAEARGIEMGRAEAAAGLSKVLRLLHVASRFEAKGQRLPTAVDFFSKVRWFLQRSVNSRVPLRLPWDGAMRRNTCFFGFEGAEGQKVSSA